MSFETYVPKRAAFSRNFEGVTVARYTTGAVTICWHPDLMPQIDPGDKVQLMLGKGEDRNKVAIAKSHDERGYTASPVTTGAKPLKISFTPPVCLKDSVVRSSQVWHHASDGLLVAMVPEDVRNSFAA